MHLHMTLGTAPECGRRTVTIRRPYDALIVCKNNPAATVWSPYGVKIIVPKLYSDRTAIVRCPLILFARIILRRPYGERTMLFVTETSYNALKKPPEASCDVLKKLRRPYDARRNRTATVRRPYGARTML